MFVFSLLHSKKQNGHFSNISIDAVFLCYNRSRICGKEAQQDWPPQGGLRFLGSDGKQEVSLFAKNSALICKRQGETLRIEPWEKTRCVCAP